MIFKHCVAVTFRVNFLLKIHFANKVAVIPREDSVFIMTFVYD